MSYNEQAAFRAEVAQVEQWWTVCIRFLSNINPSGFMLIVCLTGFSFRSRQATIHCCTSRLQEGHYPHLLSFERASEETLGYFVKTFR